LLGSILLGDEMAAFGCADAEEVPGTSVTLLIGHLPAPVLALLISVLVRGDLLASVLGKLGKGKP
jgi:hypothetical protein